MSSSQATEALVDFLRPALAASGLDLEDVEVSSAGRRRVVRVLVDKDGGVTLDDLAAATSLVGDRLDKADAMDERPYTLEVTSPGTDRPLSAARHWRRSIGRLVRVTKHQGDAFTGRVVEAHDDAAVLDVDGAATRVAYGDVDLARVELEFNRPRSTQEA